MTRMRSGWTRPVSSLASSSVATANHVAPPPSAARATRTAPWPYPLALTTAIRRVPCGKWARMRAALARTARRSTSAQRRWVVLEPTLTKHVHYERDLRQQVAGEQPGVAEALRDAAPGRGMDVDAGHGGRVRIGPLGHQRADHAREHVTGAARRQRGDLMRILAEPAVGMRDQRVR